MNAYPSPRFSLLLILFSALALPAHAELTADKVIEKSIEATGGEDAVKKIKTIDAVFGTEMVGLGLKFDTKMIVANPDKIYVEQNIPGVGLSKQAYNGTVGWQSEPIQGDRYLSNTEVEELSKSASLQRMLDWKNIYATRSLVSETDTEVTLSMQESGDKPAETWVFSKDTWLLMRMEGILDMGPMGKLPVKTILEDYREVGGVLMPGITRIENPAFKISMDLKTIRFDIEVDPKIFEPPF